MSYPSMYYPIRKLETKSPKIDKNEDLTNRDYEEKLGKNFQSPQLRPRSAKGSDKRQPKKKNGRPISAKKNLVNIASKLSIKPQQDAHLLTRLRPTFISMDKERLYEDNLALKLALNGFQTENMQIKTRLTQLEKELARKDDIIEELSANEKSPGHKYVHLINNLKQSIKEGKIELRSRDDELYKLKRNIKSTKIKELEIQIQSYEDECKRLSQNLEEALNKNSNVAPSNDYDRKFSNDVINSVKKENAELKNNLNKAQEELKRIQQERLLEGDRKKKITQGTQNVGNMKLEIQKLKMQLEGAYKEGKERESQINSELMNEKKRVEELKNRLENEEKKFKDAQKQIEALKNQPKANGRAKSPGSATPRKSPRVDIAVKKIRKVLKNQKISFDRFLNAIDRDHTGFAEIGDFLKFFSSFGNKFKKPELENISEKKSGKTVVNLIKLQKNFEKFAGSNSSSSSSEKPLIPSAAVPVFTSDFAPTEAKPIKILDKETEDCLRHISLCMQLNRISKNQIYETFFSKLDAERKISRGDLGEAIRNPPFAFPQKVSVDKLCDILMSTDTDRPKQQNLVQAKEIISRLIKILPDWEIFDSDEEEKFDSLLTKIIMKNRKLIKDNCRALDKKETGTISVADFKTAIKDFKELETDRVLQYMTLLFYSHEYELDKVPYVHFIKAYGEQQAEDSQEYSESEKAEIVKHYLNEIAQSLRKQKQTIRDVFQVENNLVYPESFITGLEHLGMKNIEHDFIILILEALQYEKENEACISIEEFEAIMENFGVSSKGKGKVVAESSDSEEIKKISIADSENYEYSDDSPGRHRISEISPFASISNLKQGSASGMKSQVKRDTPVKVDPSSKLTLAVSKIENDSGKKRESSSDSIRDILEHKPKDSSSSSFNSKKKNQHVVIKNNELVFTQSMKKSSSSEESEKVDEKISRKDFSESERYSESIEQPKKANTHKNSSKNSSIDSVDQKKDQSYEQEEYSEEKFDSSEKSNPFIPQKPESPTMAKIPSVSSPKSSSKSSKKATSSLSESFKKNSFTLGLKEQSKNSPSQEDPLPEALNQSKSSNSHNYSAKVSSKPSKKQSIEKQEYSEHFSSSKSSNSSKQAKNPNLALVFKEDLPVPSNQESLPGNTTGTFGNRDQAPLLPFTYHKPSIHENESSKPPVFPIHSQMTHDSVVPTLENKPSVPQPMFPMPPTPIPFAENQPRPDKLDETEHQIPPFLPSLETSAKTQVLIPPSLPSLETSAKTQVQNAPVFPIQSPPALPLQGPFALPVQNAPVFPIQSPPALPFQGPFALPVQSPPIIPLQTPPGIQPQNPPYIPLQTSPPNFPAIPFQSPPTLPGIEPVSTIPFQSPPSLPTGLDGIHPSPIVNSFRPGNLDSSQSDNYDSSSSKEIPTAFMNEKKNNSSSNNVLKKQQSEHSEKKERLSNSEENSVEIEYYPDESKSPTHHTVQDTNLSKKSEKNISLSNSNHLNKSEKSSKSSIPKPFEFVEKISSSESEEYYPEQKFKELSSGIPEKFSEPVKDRNESESYADDFINENIEEPKIETQKPKDASEENYEDDNFIAEDIPSYSEDEMF